MLDEAALEAHRGRIERDGFTVVEAAIEPEFVDALAADLLRLEQEREIVPSPNEFEGESTWRIYNLLAHGKLYERVPVHGNVLSLVERVLDKSALGRDELLDELRSLVSRYRRRAAAEEGEGAHAG